MKNVIQTAYVLVPISQKLLYFHVIIVLDTILVSKPVLHRAEVKIGKSDFCVYPNI